jgi:putative glutamine amidotransferase
VYVRPLIGIPCFATERAGTLRPIYANNQTYVRAVERAGGVPLLIPPLTDAESLAAVCARLDGLLLTGGGDVDPAYYGEKPIAECGEPEPERDEQEIALSRLALESDLPVLGVCRGMQLLNVVRGGTLYQDLVAQRGEPRHDHTDHPRTYRAHDIEVNPASRLAGILGGTRQAVNSLHHQAVNRPGEGIEIVAWSEDGVAEAMEAQGHPFAVAVQYHPEELASDDAASQRLFAAFVQACKERMRG